VYQRGLAILDRRKEMRRKTTFKSVVTVILAALFLAIAGCGPDPFYIHVASIEGVPETGEAGTPLILTGNVRPAFASNKDIVWVVIDAGTTGASISGNILNTSAGGTVKIRAIIANGEAEGKDYTQDFEIVFNVGGGNTDVDSGGDTEEGAITSASIYLYSPVKDEEPCSEADSGADSVNYTISDVSWSPDDNPFKGETVYTVTVTLTADEGYKFPNTFTAKINGESASISANTGTTVKISYTFAPTLGKIITSITVISPPTKMTYISGEALNLSGLMVTLIFDNGSTEEVAYSNFGAYNITTVPAHDTPLTSAHNGQHITVTAGGKSGVTGNLKVIEPITSASINIWPPAKNDIPNTGADAGGESVNYIIGDVSWSPADNPFKGETVYTAAVTLTANEGYKFPNTFTATINGNNAAVNGNTGTNVTISYIFAKTLGKVITGITIKSPPAKMTYTNGEPLNLSGIVVTLNFDEGSPEDVAYSNFSAYNISTLPAHDTPLTLAHNGQHITVTASGHSANTGNLTVNKAGASAVTFPTALPITYGAAISTATLSGSTAGRGTFAWVNGTTVPSAGTHSYDVEFSPNDTGTYDYSGIPGWNSGTNKVVRLVSITVNKKTITITPTAGQSKVYGTADPAFTYTPSETLLPGNSFTGALAYTGTNAGTYPFTLGSLSAGGNYELSLAGNVTFAITRTAGSTVTQPSGTWNFSAKTITVTAASLSTATGQEIEYAISASGTAAAASLTWTVNKLAFDITAIDTTYYIYARSRESTNYSTGTANVSAGIATPPVINVNGVTLDKSVLTIVIGNTATLKETVNPSNAADTTVSWNSDNLSVATVNGGVVTAVAAGTATITVTTADGNKTATCSVTVITPPNNDARIGTTEYPTLTAALTAAASGTASAPTEIFILRNITAQKSNNGSYAYEIPNNKHIKLTVDPGRNITITAADGNFRLFSFDSASYNTGSLTLDGGGGTLTLDGKNYYTYGYNSRGGVYIYKGILKMLNDVTITGFNSESSGGGVFISGGTFNMSGGKISGNTYRGSGNGGGGVCISSGTFNMSGGEISGNTTTYSPGGGVYTQGGNFTMSGDAKIKNNISYSSGGGVYFGEVWSGTATFTMNSGEISGNTANDNGTASSGGGGVFISSGTFIMNDGKISDNTANGSVGGGGVSILQGTFTMNGGKISINKAENGNGGGVNISNTTNYNINFNRTGGEIMNNTANRGGGVYIDRNTGTTVFTMSGGTIYGTNTPALTNTANGAAPKGVALYNNNGTAKYGNDAVIVSTGNGVDTTITGHN